MPVESHIHKIIDKIDYNDLKNLPTIPEGISYKVGDGARTTGDGIGDQAITGLGFEPSCLIVIAKAVGSNSSIVWGVASSSDNQRAMENYYNGSGWSVSINNIQFIVTRDTSANFARGNLKSFDSDGFTIDWDEVDVTVSFIWIAFS